jgi:hypothetical protein
MIERMNKASSLSQELLAITLLLVPILGLAVRSLLKNSSKSDANEVSDDIESIFNLALERFQRFDETNNGQKMDCLDSESKQIFASECSYLPIEITDTYSHQVAGHTCEILRGFKRKVLKPMVKTRLFCRELQLYEEMARDAIRSGLPKSFVPNYIGLALVATSVENNKKAKDKINPNDSMLLIMTSWYEIFKDNLLKMFSIKKIDFMGDYVSKLKNYDQPLLPHLVLDDLTIDYKMPCVIDIKMGQQTYEPTADSNKKKREILKCPYQVTTGFRITGMKVYDVVTKSYSYKEKQFGRSVDLDHVKEALKIFFWNGLLVRKDIIDCVIYKLEEILVWFGNQNILHFYCSSILIIYDGIILNDINSNNKIEKNIEIYNPNKTSSSILQQNELSIKSHKPFVSNTAESVQVKMIDFAHTLFSPKPHCIDKGYILGLKNLILNLQEIMNE